VRMFLPLLVLTGLAAAPAPVPLAPGKPVRLELQAPGGAKGVIIRVEVEAGGGDVEAPPAADPLRDELAALYAKDADPKKAEHARALADLYGWAAAALGGTDYRTAGEFRAALGKKSADALPVDVLLPLRQRVQVELRKVLPAKAGAALDADTRAKAGALFQRLAKIMGEVAR
jgi:hypothetical protein